MQIADSIYNSYIFNGVDDKMIGGYQIQNITKQKGGTSDEASSDEGNYVKFEDLVIPIGLVVNSFSTIDPLSIKSKEPECIDSDLFDKLLGLVRVVSKPKSRTKKNKNKKGL